MDVDESALGPKRFAYSDMPPPRGGGCGAAIFVGVGIFILPKGSEVPPRRASVLPGAGGKPSNFKSLEVVKLDEVSLGVPLPGQS